MDETTDLNMSFDSCSLNGSVSSNDLSFCLSEPDDQPQSVHLDLVNGSPLGEAVFFENSIETMLATTKSLLTLPFLCLAIWN